MAILIRRLNGHAGAVEFDPAPAASWQPTEGVLWVPAPLSRAAGARGANVGGISFAAQRHGFLGVCRALLLAGGLQLGLLRRLRRV